MYSLFHFSTLGIHMMWHGVVSSSYVTCNVLHIPAIKNKIHTFCCENEACNLTTVTRIHSYKRTNVNSTAELIRWQRK